MLAFVCCGWLLTLSWRSAHYGITIASPIRRRRPKPSTANKRQQNGGDGPHRHAVKQPAGCHGGQRSAAHPTPAPSATPGGPGRAMGGLGAGLRAHRQPHTATSSSLPCSGTNALATNGGAGWGGVAGLVKNPPPEPQGTHRCHLGWGGGPGPAGTGLQTSSLCHSRKICSTVSGRSLNSIRDP